MLSELDLRISIDFLSLQFKFSRPAAAFSVLLGFARDYRSLVLLVTGFSLTFETVCAFPLIMQCF